MGRATDPFIAARALRSNSRTLNYPRCRMDRSAFNVLCRTLQLAPTLQPRDVVILITVGHKSRLYAAAIVQARGAGCCFCRKLTDLNPMRNRPLEKLQSPICAPAHPGTNLRRSRSRNSEASANSNEPTECWNYSRLQAMRRDYKQRRSKSTNNLNADAAIDDRFTNISDSNPVGR